MITLTERLTPDTEHLRKLMERQAQELRVASPGIIQSFDAEKQTVTVQIAIREKVNLDGVITHEDVPILVDVPIKIPRAGGYSLTLPVAQGDECLVVFGDNCMDGWWQGGEVSDQMDKRRHDLSDGYAILGITSQPRVLGSYSTDSVQLRNDSGDAYVEIKGSVINIITAETVNIEAAEEVNVTGSDKVEIQSNTLVTIHANEQTTIEERVFLQHVHKNTQPGVGVSGVVL